MTAVRGRFWLLTGLLVVMALVSLPARDAHAALLTVTTNDGGAPVVDGDCSLREAIQNAVNNALTNVDCLMAGNVSPTVDTIQFNIGGGGIQTIAPTSAFNNLSGGPVTIDATTQPGPGALPRITLDGVGAGGATNGFTATGTNAQVRGFAIVRFGGSGILVTAGAQETVIDGNHIGVDRTGLVAQANGVGITVSSAFGTRIGGAGVNQRNVISSNIGAGIRLSGLNVGLIAGNYIGTDITGAAALGNGSHGIHATGFVTGLVVGGPVGSGSNLISGNGQNGVFFDGNDINFVSIIGNRIGTNLAGTAALANGGSGIHLNDANITQVGSVDPTAGNLISGNAIDGIQMTGNASGTEIQGNLIGLNAAGSAAIPNSQNGIQFVDATGTVGGSAATSRNIISGNGQNGILLFGSSNVGIRGNYIGTNQDGTAGVGNTASGIHVLNGTNHAIGGNTAAEGNLVSGNGFTAIRFSGSQLVDVRNNLVGTNAAGTGPIPNGSTGIGLDGSNRIEIGDIEQAGRGNTVAFNAGAGIVVATSDRIGIVDNRVFSNGGLGIDLFPFGVNANDAGDGDAGANLGQNFPVIQTAVSDATLTVTGTLNTTPNTNSVRIQVFSSVTCDPSGNGEGQTFLGEVTANTDASGNAAWQASGLPAAGVGAFITTTASTVSGTSLNTSEFSACFTATVPVSTPTPTPGPGLSPTPGPTATFTPTPTPTPSSLTNPTDPANSSGADQGKPKNEKSDGKSETDDQKRERERTNRSGSDDYRTEGNVVAVDLNASPRTATIATHDGLQVIVLLCRDSCDDPSIGDYLEADGEKEHEALFYADSVTSRRPGR
jgi:hypothetical protein